MSEDQRLTDLAPLDWFAKPDESSIWVRGYHLPALSDADLQGQTRIFDFKGSRLVLTHGTLSYLDVGKWRVEITPEKEVRLRTPSARLQDAPTGSYLLALFPFNVDGRPGSEREIRERLSTIAGVLASLGGRGIVWDRLFDNVIQLRDGSTTAYSPPVENPLWHGVPDVSEARFRAAAMILAWIEDLPTDDRRRVSTSLRWFEAALYESGIDGLLKYWIAIETLAMPDDTNVRPINEALSRIYGMSPEEVQQRFAVGRIQGLRSRIVHKGEDASVHGHLLAYLEGLYADLLAEKCRMPSLRRAIAQLSRDGFDIDVYLRAQNASG